MRGPCHRTLLGRNNPPGPVLGRGVVQFFLTKPFIGEVSVPLQHGIASCGQTHMTENITFPPPSDVGGNKKFCLIDVKTKETRCSYSKMLARSMFIGLFKVSKKSRKINEIYLIVEKYLLDCSKLAIG